MARSHIRNACFGLLKEKNCKFLFRNDSQPALREHTVHTESLWFDFLSHFNCVIELRVRPSWERGPNTCISNLWRDTFQLKLTFHWLVVCSRYESQTDFRWENSYSIRPPSQRRKNQSKIADQVFANYVPNQTQHTNWKKMTSQWKNIKTKTTSWVNFYRFSFVVNFIIS